jgi:hypothetical protein
MPACCATTKAGKSCEGRAGEDNLCVIHRIYGDSKVKVEVTVKLEEVEKVAASAPSCVEAIAEAKETLNYHSMLIFLQRKNKVDASGNSIRDDDAIKIMKVGSTYDLYYFYYYKQLSQQTHKMVNLTSADVERYIVNIIRANHIDNEPYLFIEFHMPCMPTIMFNAKMTEQQIDHTRDTLNFCFAHWPVKE